MPSKTQAARGLEDQAPLAGWASRRIIEPKTITTGQRSDPAAETAMDKAP